MNPEIAFVSAVLRFSGHGVMVDSRKVGHVGIPL
jgi:hypothetical protein